MDDATVEYETGVNGVGIHYHFNDFVCVYNISENISMNGFSRCALTKVELLSLF